MYVPMTSSPLAPDLRQHAPELARIFDAIVTNLVALISRRLFNRAGYSYDFVMALMQRIGRTRARFLRVMTNLAAGIQPGIRKPASPRGAHEPRRGGPAPFPLPRSYGWLVRTFPSEATAYGAGAHGSQLYNLIMQPEYAALIAASPQAQRILRPLFHLLAWPFDLPKLKADPPATTPPPEPALPSPLPPSRAGAAKQTQDGEGSPPLSAPAQKAAL